MTWKRCLAAIKSLIMLEGTIDQADVGTFMYLLSTEPVCRSAAELRKCFYGREAAEARAEAERIAAPWHRYNSVTGSPPPPEDLRT